MGLNNHNAESEPEKTTFTVTLQDAFGWTSQVKVEAETPSAAVTQAQQDAPAGCQVIELSF